MNFEAISFTCLILSAYFLQRALSQVHFHEWTVWQDEEERTRRRECVVCGKTERGQ